MDRHDLTPGQLLDLLARPTAAEDVATTRGAVLVVDGDAHAAPTPEAVARVAGLPAVIVRVSDVDHPEDDPLAEVVDVVVPPGDDDLAAVEASVGSSPLAATALAMLLRTGPARSVEAGLVAESAVYSTLQAGPEFAAWR